ncbi:MULTISPECIES: protease complex subunit PrcB family protein [unclassified Flavobacterium]|uniref:protease complex subunit PrcB family protein n=1 Tax=unclassified Flavobacterium TaxID=196869 RepID=UPI001290A289|nr:MULTISPECIES: protease complex subunit PrcB family protein [unclassified Flavobacterium]MQP53488.1 protease complex subunit PrcB family protein [Flavobacterium sp. LMO9]MQP63409.1 protease complex subunit PrcB family protein [Flavobacterium sp. LMO6]
MIKILPFLFLIISCSPPKKIMDTTFTIIYNNQIGGSENAGHMVIQDNESYIQFIESLKLEETQFANFLKVDFKKKNVLVLNQGQKNSGGYEITIESIVNDNNTIIVKKKETGPKKGEMATSVITTPYCIALIPKGNKIIVE